MVVCGPSGNTDLNLSILTLFDNFDINLAIFACIAQMCNTPDHSPCEILLASIPYGLTDWSIEEDSFKYVNKKLKIYSNNWEAICSKNNILNKKLTDLAIFI